MAGARYFGHLGSTFWFVSGVRLVADGYDELHADRNRELHGIEARPPVGPAAATIEQQWWVLNDMLLARVVDNYLTFLSQTLAAVFEMRPEALRSRDKMEVEEVLRHDSMEDLVATIAEKKVRDLSYRSVPDIGGYFDKRLGISLTPSRGDLSAIEVLVAQRNVVVHNRAKVDHLYKRKVHSSFERIGEDLPVGYEHVVAAARTLSCSVRHIEEQVIAKFPALSIGG